MGADMLIATLAAPKDALLDFGSGHRAIELLEASAVVEPEEVCDPDLDWSGDMTELRRHLHALLSQLEGALEGREFTWTTIAGLNVYVTGGLSWGDAPTEAFDLVNRLRAVAGVLSAVGFVEGWLTAKTSGCT